MKKRKEYLTGNPPNTKRPWKPSTASQKKCAKRNSKEEPLTLNKMKRTLNLIKRVNRCGFTKKSAWTLISSWKNICFWPTEKWRNSYTKLAKNTKARSRLFIAFTISQTEKKSPSLAFFSAPSDMTSRTPAEKFPPKISKCCSSKLKAGRKSL